MSDYYKVAEAINEAFLKAYPHPEIIGRTANADILCKRVGMLIDDLLCTRTNCRVINKTLADRDRTYRGIRNYWWQFWRRKA